jgi:hypothetical protein
VKVSVESEEVEEIEAFFYFERKCALSSLKLEIEKFVRMRRILLQDEAAV